MLNSKKGLVAILVSVALIMTLAAITFAVLGNRPGSSDGNFESNYVGRVNITAEKTSFNIDKLQDGQKENISLTLSVKKTEPEFYAKIVSTSIKGLNHDYAVWTSVEGDKDFPEDAILPVGDDGEPKALKWSLSAPFTVPDIFDTEPYIEIRLLSGVSELLATESIVKIPLKITIINKKELSRLVNIGHSVINQTGANPDSELYQAVDEAAKLLLTQCTQQEVDSAVNNLKNHLGY